MGRARSARVQAPLSKKTVFTKESLQKMPPASLHAHTQYAYAYIPAQDLSLFSKTYPSSQEQLNPLLVLMHI